MNYTSSKRKMGNLNYFKKLFFDGIYGLNWWNQINVFFDFNIPLFSCIVQPGFVIAGDLTTTVIRKEQKKIQDKVLFTTELEFLIILVCTVLKIS